MPAPVVAERIGWPYSKSPPVKRLTKIRLEYLGIDPVDRIVYERGQVTQCDLWFPEPRIVLAPPRDRFKGASARLTRAVASGT